MKRLFRSSAAVLAFGYILFGVVALVLFAVPLWYAWQRTVEEGRAEILRADAQRLTEVFRRSGPNGLKAFVDERVSLQIAGERILLLADSSLHPIAGNLPQWPRDVPLGAGTYTVQLTLDGHPTRAVVVHATLEGATTCSSGAIRLVTCPSKRTSGTGLPAQWRCSRWLA